MQLQQLRGAGNSYQGKGNQRLNCKTGWPPEEGGFHIAAKRETRKGEHLARGEGESLSERINK